MNSSKKTLIYNQITFLLPLFVCPPCLGYIWSLFLSSMPGTRFFRTSIGTGALDLAGLGGSGAVLTAYDGVQGIAHRTGHGMSIEIAVDLAQ